MIADNSTWECTCVPTLWLTYLLGLCLLNVDDHDNCWTISIAESLKCSISEEIGHSSAHSLKEVLCCCIVVLFNSVNMMVNLFHTPIMKDLHIIYNE